MTGAFLFLTLCSFRNRILSQLRRLKRPRYLFSAVIGGVYFYFVAGRHWINGMRFAGQAGRAMLPVGLLEVVASVLVLGSIVVSWCAPSPVSPLTFSEAEIQYLFPAPVSRRSLVKWKLMRGQLGVLFSIVIFTAVSGPYFARGNRVLFLAGAWILFATMQFHLTGIRMARHNLQRRGIGWATRTAITSFLAVSAVGLCILWAAKNVGPPDPATIKNLAGQGSVSDYVGRLFGAGPAWLLTWPARLIIRPALASDAAGFLLAIPAALALLLVNYAWVLRAGVVLEEGALAAARRLEESREAHLRGRLGRTRKVRAVPAPFALAPTGRPEVALIWKNMIAALRGIGGMPTFLWLMAACMVPALVSMVARGHGLDVVFQIAGTLCGISAIALLLVGPSILRCDFRQDLQHIDLLKTYPLRGYSLVMGTLLAPVMLLTIIQYVLFACFAILNTSSFGEFLPTRSGPAALAVAGAIVALPMNMVAALIQNAALLLIPGWVSLGPVRTSGPERIGQGMITTLGFLLVMAVSVIPAAAVFALTFFVLSKFLGNTGALPVSALPAAAVILAEAWIGLLILGAFLDRFDPSRELDSLTR
ncbi:MAG TPA: hypothetical protein VFE84_05860 [Patescibacteria group bacterium]|nr:hypothetical protein [Patescibacteria group bacterium]